MAATNDISTKRARLAELQAAAAAMVASSLLVITNSLRLGSAEAGR